MDWAGGTADDSWGRGPGTGAWRRCGTGWPGTCCDSVRSDGDCGGGALCTGRRGGAPGGTAAAFAELSTGQCGDDPVCGSGVGGTNVAAPGVALCGGVFYVGGCVAAGRPCDIPCFEAC